METNWYEFGKDDATGDYFLRLRLVAGGHLAFVMNKGMAEGLAQVLIAMGLGAASPQPPSNAKN
jgi:hypothetical protein